MLLKNKIKLFIRLHPNIGNVARYFLSLITKKNKLEKKVSFGKVNNSHCIYVIRPITEDGVQGLMSLFIQVMRSIDYANRNEYIPYVDFKNYYTQYSVEGQNSWEYFFSQPSNLSLSYIYNCKNVILSGLKIKKDKSDLLYKDSIFFDEKICKTCHDLIFDNISLSEDIRNIVKRELKKIDVNHSIGVYIRGTDYVKLKPTGEHVQPDIEDVIYSMKKFSQNYPTMNFFLVTEDGEIFKKLKRQFADKIQTVSFDSFIDNYNYNGFLSESKLLNDDKRGRGIDYLVKIVILSKCRFLISSITMGSIAAYAMNGGKYEEKKIFNLGLYK